MKSEEGLKQLLLLFLFLLCFLRQKFRFFLHCQTSGKKPQDDNKRPRTEVKGFQLILYRNRFAGHPCLFQTLRCLSYPKELQKYVALARGQFSLRMTGFSSHSIPVSMSCTIPSLSSRRREGWGSPLEHVRLSPAGVLFPLGALPVGVG